MVFCAEMEKVREIRNDVMHFDPDGIDEEQYDQLRIFVVARRIGRVSANDCINYASQRRKVCTARAPSNGMRRQLIATHVSQVPFNLAYSIRQSSDKCGRVG